MVWVAVDWGTSNLRLWAMEGARPVAERRSDRGMGRLSPGDYAGVLGDLVGDWLPASGPLDVVVCGMAGARQGWVEAGYRAVPCPPLGSGWVVPGDAGPRLSVRILPGLSQSAPPDVMRGEETQIAGLLAEEPGLEGTVCLPGTHSKWVRVAGGQVTGFNTLMTGELFELLSTKSVLRHGMAGEGEDGAAFDAAVKEALARPEALLTGLFTLRAAGLLEGLAPASARARLSGLLIGAEIAAVRPEGRVIVLGSGAVSGLYARALRLSGVEVRVADDTAATLAGLTAAKAMMEGTTCAT